MGIEYVLLSVVLTLMGILNDHLKSGQRRPITIMLEEDDVYYFEHDKGRLFMAVTEMFHT